MTRDWQLGDDPFAFVVDPVAWGEPDRALGRAVCESIERTMPPTPWVPPARGRWHCLATLSAWLLVALIFLATLGSCAARATTEREEAPVHVDFLS